MRRLYSLLQLVDSSFPSGAFAHSGGFEGLLEQNPTQAADLPNLLRSVWREQLLWGDGALGLAVHRAACRGDLLQVLELDARVVALKLGRELREAALRTGHGFLDEARRVFPHALLDAYAREVAAGRGPGTHTACFALVGASLGLDEATCLLAWGYQWANQQTAALVRLGVLGHRGAVRIVEQLRPVIESGIGDVLATPGPIVSSFAPGLEIASMAHERQYSRLFQS